MTRLGHGGGEGMVREPVSGVRLGKHTSQVFRCDVKSTLVSQPLQSTCDVQTLSEHRLQQGH